MTWRRVSSTGVGCRVSSGLRNAPINNDWRRSAEEKLSQRGMGTHSFAYPLSTGDGKHHGKWNGITALSPHLDTLLGVTSPYLTPFRLLISVRN
jgi:hypothetical protein